MTSAEEPADLPAAGAVTLRHRDANRQAALYGVFAVVVLGVIAAWVLLRFSGPWWSLVLVPVALFLGYSSVRLATLKVRLDEDGIWEPNPFRLTHVTPWSDVARVDAATTDGRLGFRTVRITHADRDTHDVVALHVQAGAAYAQEAIDEWVQQMREGKKRWG